MGVIKAFVLQRQIRNEKKKLEREKVAVFAFRKNRGECLKWLCKILYVFSKPWK